MALTFAETKEIEELKQDHKVKLIAITLNATKEEHALKMNRLEKQLEIAKATSTPE